MVGHRTIARAAGAMLTLAALGACAGWTTPAQRGEPTPEQVEAARVAQFRAMKAALAALSDTTSGPVTRITVHGLGPSDSQIEDLRANALSRGVYLPTLGDIVRKTEPPPSPRP